jgi:hypothetical protein
MVKGNLMDLVCVLIVVAFFGATLLALELLERL